MSSQICPKMNGNKCAESYCDMWDLHEKRCSYAVVEEKKVELFDLLINKINKEEINKKSINDIKKSAVRLFH